MLGEVLNQAAKRLSRERYDVAVIGGGMLGLACAFYLKKWRPDRSVIIIEQDGIPSEEGASFVSPAVAHNLFEDEVVRQKALWGLERLNNLREETGVDRPHDTPFYQVGLLRVTKDPPEMLATFAQDWKTYSQHLPKDQREALASLVRLEPSTKLLYDPLGGYGSAEAVALHYGFGAVAQGCDLMLNTRVLPLSEKELALERLAFNRQMRREVVRVERLEAETVIVAAGATTPALVEEGAGALLPVKRVYQQYPRVEADPRLPLDKNKVKLPVLQHRDFTLRPQGEGLLVVPPPLPPDPAGYVPQGGKLMGVRVGLRREVLERLMNHTDALPVLAWESLNPGKTVTKVRGSWDIAATYPTWHAFPETSWYALLGGREGFGLGLAEAFDLAATLSKHTGRPWTSE